jgi:hypothetical protein
MTQTTSGASETHGSAATKPLDTAEDNPWWGQNAPEVSLRWWESVPTAYWQGLVDGAALERAQREPEDDIVHRTAVRGAIRLVVRTERRERADRGEAAT